MSKPVFVADFETTTNPDDCRVWAFAVCSLENPEDVILGTTIEQFLDWCEEQKGNPKIFFHNLKFDSHAVMDALFHQKYKHVTENKDRQSHTFTTLISDTGAFYQIEIIFKRKGRRIQKVTLQDSYKLIPLKVAKIPKAFGLAENKLKLDYDCHNNLPKGTPLTEHEKDYVKADVIIVAKALKFMFDSGMDKMTIGACALKEYKELIGKDNFKRWFPEPTLAYDLDVRQSYRGGFTYVNPDWVGKDVKEGICLDINSLYPSQMRSHDNAYPYGIPCFFKGKYQHDEIYPLYIQMFKCQFEIKPHKIPTIQIKGSPFFVGNEYLTSSHGEEVTLCLTSVDLELFLDHYNVYNPEWLSGWKFRACVGLFDKYIDKWNEIKMQATREGNKGMRTIAKLALNNLYGKFSSRMLAVEKIPFFDEKEQKIKYKFSEEKQKRGIYIAIGSFITSYSRRLTISSFQRIQDDYYAGKSDIQAVYSDTDSLKLYSPGFKLPEGLDIDPVKLGAWKYEGKFCDKGQKPGRGARFLRQKCYIENLCEDPDGDDYKLEVVVAGMPDDCHEHVNFDNFQIGAYYPGKKVPKVVPGGIVLEETDFTIKP